MEGGEEGSKQSVGHMCCICFVGMHENDRCYKRVWLMQKGLGPAQIPGFNSGRGINGIVGEYAVAIDLAQARFPADAHSLKGRLARMLRWLPGPVLLPIHNGVAWH